MLRASARCACQRFVIGGVVCRCGARMHAVILKKRIFVLLLAVAVAVLFNALPLQAEELTILAFGDSITQGFKRDALGNIWGITSPPHGARVGGYEPYLEWIFVHDARSRGDTAIVRNWGYGGERTQTGVGRLRNILAGSSGVYDYCLIMEGANDLYAGVSPASTAFNLGLMVDNCRAAGVTPIMATITKNWNIAAGDLIPQIYNPAVVAKAKEKNVLLADQYAMTQRYWYEVFTGDHLHLNELGDLRMAEVWFDTLVQDSRFQRKVPVGAYLLLLR